MARCLSFTALAILLLAPAVAPAQSGADAALIQKARAIHELRVMTEVEKVAKQIQSGRK